MMTVTRCLVSWLLAEGWLGLCALATLTLAFGNFVVAWQSFVAQGFEPIPLRHIPFLGPWAEAFALGDAPLASLYALVLTVAMNIAVITSVKMVARMYQLYFDYRDVRRAQDSAVHSRAEDYLDMMLKTGLWLLPMLGFTILVIMWDVAQFRFRYETLFRDLTEPAEVLQWAPEAVARLGHFLARFMLTAVWGYVGCVVGMALAMEYGFMRAGEQWQVLDNAFRQAIEGERTRQEQQPPAPVETLAGAAEPVRQTAGGPRRARIAEPVIGGAPEARPASLPRPPEQVAAPEPSPETPVTAPPTGEPEIEVIVGPGETRRIPLAELEARPDQYVRAESGRAWFLRTYYEQGVMDRPSEEERQR